VLLVEFLDRDWGRRESSDSRFLLALSEACVDRSLPRLGELVSEVFFQLWSQLPAAPVNPELQKLVPLGAQRTPSSPGFVEQRPGAR
jgi:hypothetical protein